MTSTKCDKFENVTDKNIKIRLYKKIKKLQIASKKCDKQKCDKENRKIRLDTERNKQADNEIKKLKTD